MYGPFGSPVFRREMFQQQNIMDPAFMRMLQIRDTMRQTGARPDTPQMLEGNTDMGTPLEALPGDESFGQLGYINQVNRTQPALDRSAKLQIGQPAPQQEAQLQQVQQAVNEMQQNQQALADHLGAGSRMANNQKLLDLNQRQAGAGLAGLFQPQPFQPQPARLTNVRLQQTLGPESLMRYT